jgi:hypothetical protein
MDPGPSSRFEQVLSQFTATLNAQQREDFKFTTLEDLRKETAAIQLKQSGSRRLMNLRRIEPFLEGMQQYATIIEVFLNTSKFVAFVWVCVSPFAF